MSQVTVKQPKHIFRINGNEFAFYVHGSGYMMVEYRQVKSFRGYRTVEIKPVYVASVISGLRTRYSNEHIKVNAVKANEQGHFE